MDLATLIDERSIERALFAIARAMDQRDWVAMNDILVENATGDFGAGVTCNSREEFVAMFRRFLDDCGPTQHLLGNIAIEIDGDTAKSFSYVRDFHRGAGDRSDLIYSGVGEYRDQWQRTPEGWRLTHRHKLNFTFEGTYEALGDTP